MKQPYISKSLSNNYITPKSIIQKYCGTLDIFDPCPYCEGEPLIDGLLSDWDLDRVVFVNPPFSHLKQWSQKVYEQSLRGCRIVLLAPARTDAIYFKKWVLAKADFLIFSKRISFISKERPEMTAPAPLSIVFAFYNMEPKAEYLSQFVLFGRL